MFYSRSNKTHCCYSVNIGRRKFRLLIKHYILLTIQQSKEKLQNYYGDSAAVYFMVSKWFINSQNSHVSTDDAERTGPLYRVTIAEVT